MVLREVTAEYRIHSLDYTPCGAEPESQTAVGCPSGTCCGAPWGDTEKWIQRWEETRVCGVLTGAQPSWWGEERGGFCGMEQTSCWGEAPKSDGEALAGGA